MIRSRVVALLRNIGSRLGATAIGSEWHLFGSVDRDEPTAADIDLMILCASALQADALRQAIDPDELPLPLHLSLLTYAESAEVDAVAVQHASKIHP